MARYTVKIEKEIEAELPDEASAKFRKFLMETVRENPDQLLINVNRPTGGRRNRKPNLTKDTAGN
jgi:mRNA-degrading endonuclease RelE of RelBE toxin-antitoxin system